MKHTLLMALALVCALSAPAMAAKSVAEQRVAIQKMEGDILSTLYKAQPDTEREIRDAAGYAVFSSGELALIWVSAGFGHGVAHDNNSGNDIYMKTAKAGVGLGAGAKDYNTVFVFHDTKSFNDFTTTGLDLTGSADVTAKAGEKGASATGAADVMPGVRIYQLTDTGLIAQAMIQGTKYWKDDDLNQ